uniref:Uncharacterized protein n=1 Tax=Acrobeloides nanus TaxID=290746 RepID=A0A914DYY6_9BILA
MFIPNIIYAAGCQYDRWHCIAGGSNGIVSMIYQITVLLFLHSSRITIWRCFDEFVSLLCQWRILKQQSKTHTEVKSIPNQTISTRTS